MAQDLALSYAAIIKSEKQEDGTLKVYGKATDDSIDIDQQICDDAWLQKAMPDWFVSGGNIREQHSNIASGVATDYEAKADGHYITALVVDPVSVKKVEAGVLKGFSIGIRGPRVVRDTKAAGGRIVDGQIIEISLVDRPANPNAKLMLAKAAADGTLESVKQLSIPTPADLNKFNENHDESGRFSSGDGGSSNGTSHDVSGSGVPDVNGNGHFAGGPEAQRVLEVNNALDRYGKNNGVFQENGTAPIISSSDYKNNPEFRVNASSSDKGPGFGFQSNDRATAIAGHSAADQISNVMTGAGAGRGSWTELQNPTYDRATGKFTATMDANPFSGTPSTPISATVSESVRTAINSVIPDGKKSAIVDLAKSDEPDASVEATVEGTTMPEETVVTEEAVVDAPEVTEEVVVEETATEETEAPAEEAPAKETPVEEDATAEIVEAAKSLLGTLNKFDQAKYDTAVNAIADLIVVEAEEMKLGHDERDSIKELLRAAKHLAHWYEGEVEEGEVAGVTPEGDLTSDDIYMSADATEDCGCDGGDGCECADDKMCKCNMAAKSATPTVTVDEDQISGIINKAVASAKAAVTDEIDALKTALEAESAKAIQLAEELATAKKAAVAGGPKRAIITKSTQDLNELFIKAAEFRAKAAATEDKTLAEGYRELAEDFEAKANKRK